MTYGVILATRDPLLHAEIQDLFRESDDFTVVRSVSSAAALVAEINEREPDLVLLHEALGPAPALATVRDLLSRRPTLAVVLITRESDAALLAAAMEAGARGLVTLPVSFTDVQTRLVSAAAWSVRLRSRLADSDDPDNATTLGRIVAVAGAKGGCGASTVATQLALVTARSGRRVCLVDLDLQAGDISTLFGVNAHHDVADLVDVADELTRPTIAEVLFRHSSGIHILPAPVEGERSETVTVGVTRRVLGVLRTMFDAVVVDCGTTASQANLGAIEIADHVLVVCTPDVLSLRGAHRLTRMWDRLQIRKQADCEVVLNRAGRSAAVQPPLARRVIESPLSPVIVPARFRRLEQAANTGTAQEVSDRRLATAYRRLATHTHLLERPANDAGVLQSAQFALTVPALLLLVTFVLQCLLIGGGALVGQRLAIDAAHGLEQGRSVAEVRAAAGASLPLGLRVTSVADDGGRLTVRLRVPSLVPGLRDRLAVTSAAAVAPAPPAPDPAASDPAASDPAASDPSAPAAPAAAGGELR